ncbi:MAG: M15 family metallopeptidase [Microbacterium sp.]
MGDEAVDPEADARASADTAPIQIVRTRLRTPTAAVDLPVADAEPLTRAQARALAQSPAPTGPTAVHLAPLHREPPPLPADPDPAPDQGWIAPTADDALPLRRRSRELLDVGVLPRPTPVHHARVRHLFRFGTSGALAIAALLVVGSASAVTAANLPPTPPAVAEDAPESPSEPEVEPPVFIPPEIASGALGAYALQPQPAAVESTQLDLCATPAFTAALASGDDAATIAAAGGAVAFRDAVAAGRASCVALDDPGRVWVVVDKQRPFEPIDFHPTPLAPPAGMRNPDGGTLRTDAAAALSAMAEASRAAGAGEIGVVSAFRSYETQVDTYNGHVSRRGVDGADLVSARPGFSEHQSGLAADVAPCGAECASIDDLAASPQGAWILEHAWEYGWIVRYEDGATPATGYLAEPWHLRYIGPDLARAYHGGEWQTLEEFFGLPPAPDYAG